jgi:hypothetical protein
VGELVIGGEPGGMGREGEFSFIVAVLKEEENKIS